MPVKSADGKEYEYIVVDDYSRAVYARPLRHKSEAPEAFKVFKAAAENESQKKVREVMTDNVREICMGEIRDIIGVLTGAVRAMLHDSGLPEYAV